MVYCVSFSVVVCCFVFCFVTVVVCSVLRLWLL